MYSDQTNCLHENAHLSLIQSINKLYSLNPKQITLGQKATSMSNFSVRGSPTAIRIHSKKVRKIVFKIFRIFL